MHTWAAGTSGMESNPSKHDGPPRSVSSVEEQQHDTLRVACATHARSTNKPTSPHIRDPTRKAATHMANNPRRANGTARTRIKQRWLSIENPPICRYCHQPIDTSLKWPNPMSFSINEKIPVSKGGNPFQFDNTEPMHLHCNSKLGNKQKPTQNTHTTSQQPIPTSRKW